MLSSKLLKSYTVRKPNKYNYLFLFHKIIYDNWGLQVSKSFCIIRMKIKHATVRNSNTLRVTDFFSRERPPNCIFFLSSLMDREQTSDDFVISTTQSSILLKKICDRKFCNVMEINSALTQKCLIFRTVCTGSSILLIIINLLIQTVASALTLNYIIL